MVVMTPLQINRQSIIGGTPGGAGKRHLRRQSALLNQGKSVIELCIDISSCGEWATMSKLSSHFEVVWVQGYV